MLNLP
jgi:MFS family permease